MRDTLRAKMLLVTMAVCLVAQGAFAVPDCRCVERATTPPCHQSSVPERGSCCSGDESPITSGACTTAMQSSCCAGGSAPATESVAAAPANDPGGDSGLAQPASAVAPAESVVPVGGPAPTRPPAPPAGPVWLLKATLLN